MSAAASESIDPIYDMPVLRRVGKRYVLLDACGYLIREGTLFINHLAGLYAEGTARQYADAVLELYRVLAAQNGGEGIELEGISDRLLSEMRQDNLTSRKVDIDTWKAKATVIFRLLTWVQDNGLYVRLIGHEQLGSSTGFRVKLPIGGFLDHDVMKGSGTTKKPELPTSDDLELVATTLVSGFRSPDLQKQHTVMASMFDGSTLRRSEVVLLPLDCVPSRKWLKARRRAVERHPNILPSPVALKVPRRKGGGNNKTAYFALEVVEELRDFIDYVRPRLLKSGVVCNTVFVSKNTGTSYNPKSYTNAFKGAAHFAAATYPREFGQIDMKTLRPHHYRHRSITDTIVAAMNTGMPADKAVHQAMEIAGIRRLETIEIYIHLAEAQLQIGSPALAQMLGPVKARLRERIEALTRLESRKPRRRAARRGKRT
ncbi:site-specific recombinase XerD [Rhizobium leguminosarum]|uniref:site-specific integrase n=1 Tax=Rhizobium leguminosarum TaxID=384 RepID=UPI0016195329|nr:site-specific integrase [Rhizobium leguminosarum]MBB4587949.1 site-specific recombinase XerD [Rhizobium leguminosarum]